MQSRILYGATFHGSINGNLIVLALSRSGRGGSQTHGFSFDGFRESWLAQEDSQAPPVSLLAVVLF